MYADNQDCVIAGTPERTIMVVSHTSTTPFTFAVERIYDLTGAIAEDDGIQALQPDFSGRLLITSKGGVVGTLNMNPANVLGTLRLPGEKGGNGTQSKKQGELP